MNENECMLVFVAICSITIIALAYIFTKGD